MEFHHISVDIMVELAIVSILREVIIKGALEIERIKLVGLSALIIVLGLLLKFGGIRVKFSREKRAYKPFFQPKAIKKHEKFS